MTTFFFQNRSRQCRTDINEHHAYYTGAVEQVLQTQTNVCCGMPEKPADAISKVLNSEIFPCFARIIDCFHNASTIICLTKAKVLLPDNRCYYSNLPEPETPLPKILNSPLTKESFWFNSNIWQL